jgi:hypothetical protein
MKRQVPILISFKVTVKGYEIPHYQLSHFSCLLCQNKSRLESSIAN